jgi:hypothetical protein
MRGEKLTRRVLGRNVDYRLPAPFEKLKDGTVDLSPLADRA